MLSAIILVIVGVLSLAATANAFRPIRQQWLLFPSFLASWLTIELPVHLVGLQLIALLLLGWLGAFDSILGWVGLILLLLSWLGRAVLLIQGRGSGIVVDDALTAAGIPRRGDRVPISRLALPFLMRRRRVERLKDIEYRRVAGRVLKLDVYRPTEDGPARPVMMYLHGGAWTVGDKREQGLPMLNHLAANGWVCFSVNYRLSPGATFPDHLEDAKAAVAWIRVHGHKYGADPSFLAVSGGSAGGHLAALLALTVDDARYESGFEQADTSIQAAIPIYGIYDLTNRTGAHTEAFISVLLEPIVMKAFLADEPERFHGASPVDLIHHTAPPFLVVQGDRDTLAPVAEAREFVALLSQQSESPVVYMEFPGAQHAFDIFYSLRTARMIEGVFSFVEEMWIRSGTPSPQTVAGDDPES